MKAQHNFHANRDLRTPATTSLNRPIRLCRVFDKAELDELVNSSWELSRRQVSLQANRDSSE